jgi:hypothetical protein
LHDTTSSIKQGVSAGTEGITMPLSVNCAGRIYALNIFRIFLIDSGILSSSAALRNRQIYINIYWQAVRRFITIHLYIQKYRIPSRAWTGSKLAQMSQICIKSMAELRDRVINVLTHIENQIRLPVDFNGPP